MLSIKNIVRLLITLAIFYGIWLMVCLTIPYAKFDRYTDFLMTKQLVYHIKSWRVGFYVHVLVSTFVLIAGLLQFSKYLLYKHPRWHRNIGKVYVFIVLFASGPGGLIMSFYANGGWPARVSFVILSCLWLYTTAMAWRYALQRKWQPHINMMIRSYALTLSALTLRFYAYMIDLLNIPIKPILAYIWIAWLSWTLNLIVAEVMIRYGPLRLEGTKVRQG
ncbi:MAG: DUF2306 domain-containing protein [Filimonas sp.]|nr:DUF2306 domain-containing protein [Filimonas sp.]